MPYIWRSLVHICDSRRPASVRGASRVCQTVLNLACDAQVCPLKLKTQQSPVHLLCIRVACYRKTLSGRQ